MLQVIGYSILDVNRSLQQNDIPVTDQQNRHISQQVQDSEHKVAGVVETAGLVSMVHFVFELWNLARLSPCSWSIRLYWRTSAALIHIEVTYHFQLMTHANSTQLLA